MRRALLLLSLLVLTACAPEQGDVVDKDYDPERTWYSTEPVYTTETYSCPKTKTTTSNGKSTTSTYMSTCTRQRQTGTHQVQHYSPERYRLKIQDGDDVGWIEVPERTYDKAKIGDYYEKGGTIR